MATSVLMRPVSRVGLDFVPLDDLQPNISQSHCTFITPKRAVDLRHSHRFKEGLPALSDVQRALRMPRNFIRAGLLFHFFWFFIFWPALLIRPASISFREFDVYVSYHYAMSTFMLFSRCKLFLHAVFNNFPVEHILATIVCSHATSCWNNRLHP